MSDAQTDDHPNVRVPRYTRRLPDKILAVFHQACDQHDFEVAARLLTVLEMMLTHKPADADRRRGVGSLVMAHERLWDLRHPAVEEVLKLQSTRQPLPHIMCDAPDGGASQVR